MVVPLTSSSQLNSFNARNKTYNATPRYRASVLLNRIKVVSEVAELVPILRAVDSDVKSEVFQEISDVLHAAMMPEDAYAAIEAQIFEMVGPEGKFSGDVADKLKVSQTKLKALVKRSPRLDFRGHRIIRFEE